MISKVYILFSVFLILTLIFISIYFAKVNGASKKKWPLLLYMFVVGILIGLISVQGFFEFTKLPLWIFIAAQLWLLIIGILHATQFEKIIPLDNKNTGNILFTLGVVLFAYVLVFLAFMIYFQTPFPRMYLLQALLFIAPTFVLIAFNSFIQIPVKVFKAWGCPAPGSLPDPTDQEMAEPIIVNFEIRKQLEDKQTVFKAKAPKFMELGKLYFFFISDYNARNPNNPILMKDSNNKQFKWIFYQPGNIISGKIHLDPEITISENRIKENTSVICERVNL